jgi:dihydroflavonol-4-reductase
MSDLVFVSGASGFIASYIVKELLASGRRVRGSVRSLGKKADHEHLRALPGANERLELVEAELLAPHAFDAHVADVDFVMHTASPYVLDAKDPQKDLVDPAVQGTRSMLEACAKSSSVKRVVLTSSMAAITDEPEGDRALTEDDWNDKSSLDRNPYYLSKTLAEREAWRFVEANKPRWDLVVINPFLVIGPSMTPSINTSNQVFVDMVKGTYPGIMNLTWGMVDVRDVAHAHVLALDEKAAKGRYICANTTIAMRDVVQLLRDRGWADTKLPKLGLDCSVGDYAAKLGSYLQPKGVGSYIRTHIGRVPRFDNAKIKRELHLEFRPLTETIVDTMNDLGKWGHVPSAKA